MSHACLGLEHRILRDLRDLDPPRRWLLAVSGGLDSMVLLDFVWRWRRYLNVECVVGHVHHGTRENAEFRARAQSLVRGFCRDRRIPFVTLLPRDRAVRSEAELREFRHRTLQRWRRKYQLDLVVLAHHRDDLLETRMLRLIRGVGTEGLRAMRARDGRTLRPLLPLTRPELETYASARGVTHVEDPSNASTDPFRNWLRNDWLPRLEARQPGAVRALTRSLEALAPAEERVTLPAHVGVRRDSLRGVSSPQQRAIVAGYLRAIGARGYGRSHVEEIVKRLRTSRRSFAFNMLGLHFRVTPDLLTASRV